MRPHRKGKKIGLIIVGVIGIAALFGVVVMQLWNWLVPTLFAGPEVTFWQALGLFILAKLLFGFGPGGKRGGPHWKHKWKRKMAHMTPEERERFRERFMCKWDSHEPKPAESTTKTNVE